jgi:TetR/AcrR family transcriptional regulator
MSRKERTERERENRKNDIINTAELLFFSRGYENTMMDDIARKAEFSKTTIYSYFKSKEEIFLLVHLRGLVKRRALLQAMEKETTGIDKLRKFGKEYYTFYRKYPEYLRLQLYWSVYGINIKIINPEIVEAFKQENERGLTALRQAFHLALENSTNPLATDLDRLVSYYLQTLRVVINQSLFAVDPFNRYKDRDYYFRYLDLFLTSITAIAPKTKG